MGLGFILAILTSGCALMIACLRVACGSSVYAQKKSSRILGVCSLLGAETCSLPVTRKVGFAVTVAVVVMVAEGAMLGGWLLLAAAAAASAVRVG